MELGGSTERHVAEIYNRCWFVRHRQRGIRLDSHAKLRADAIRALGIVVRQAFQESEDFEVLLRAIVDGLSPRQPDF